MSEHQFPGGFEDLSEWSAWALDTADERQTKRRNATSAELDAFYEALVPRLEAILEEVDKFPLGGLPPSHHAIYNIALSIAEIAPHVELYKSDPDVPYAFEETRMIATHGREATWQGAAPGKAA